jgi:hypothetical protein
MKKDLSPEELQAWAEKKRKQQHEAYKRWWHSPKGAAYKQKLKERKALQVK